MLCKVRKFLKPIVRISIISIALAVIVNLITIAVVTGFQQEVRQKISGFGAHIFVMAAGENTVYESEAVRADQDFIPSVYENENIKINLCCWFISLFFFNQKRMK